MMNERYKKDFLMAGALAKEVRLFGKSLIKKGASYNDTILKIHEKIVSLGARAAFPPQIALNHVAAHFLPQPDEDIIFANDIVKLDIGVCYNGAIGDCAVTVDLSGKYQNLVDAVEEALIMAEQSLHIGQKVSDIGKIIEETIGNYGFTSVKNLAGHGLGFYKVHTPPTIPNYDDNSTQTLKKGMTFAIEPFGTNGRGLIYDAGNPTIFSYTKKGPLSSKVAHYLINKIKSFNGLPFSLHDLLDKEFSLFEIKNGIAELMTAGIIGGYAPLIEKAHGMVAQAENSVLIDEDGNIFITTR